MPLARRTDRYGGYIVEKGEILKRNLPCHENDIRPGVVTRKLVRRHFQATDPTQPTSSASTRWPRAKPPG